MTTQELLDKHQERMAKTEFAVHKAFGNNKTYKEVYELVGRVISNYSFEKYVKVQEVHDNMERNLAYSTRKVDTENYKAHLAFYKDILKNFF